jgi:hypothetical protein
MKICSDLGEHTKGALAWRRAAFWLQFMHAH